MYEMETYNYFDNITVILHCCSKGDSFPLEVNTGDDYSSDKSSILSLLATASNSVLVQLVGHC